MKSTVTSTIEEVAIPIAASEDIVPITVESDIKLFMPTPELDSDKFISKIAYIAAKNMVKNVLVSSLLKEDGMVTAIKEAKIKYLKTLVGTPNFEVSYLTVFGEYPFDLNLKLVGLSHFVKCKNTALTALKTSSTQELKGIFICTFIYVYIVMVCIPIWYIYMHIFVFYRSSTGSCRVRCSRFQNIYVPYISKLYAICICIYYMFVYSVYESIHMYIYTSLTGAALAAVEYVIVASKVLICHIDQNKVAADLGVNAGKNKEPFIHYNISLLSCLCIYIYTSVRTKDI
jgi:hypothetical protein